jgi:hypothetical protein
MEGRQEAREHLMETGSLGVFKLRKDVDPEHWRALDADDAVEKVRKGAGAVAGYHLPIQNLPDKE